MTILRNIFAVAALAVASLVSVSPAHANETAWVEMKPARYRLVAAEIDGQYFAALQIDMKPGWHTYWRHPGASGIAPEFDFSTSRNVSVGAVDYPAPYFFDDGIGGFYGYDGMAGFVFPLSVKDTALNNAEVRLNGLIGVCREVCIPIEVKLSLPIKSGVSSPHSAFIEKLRRARAQAPSDDLRIESASFDGVSLQVVVTGQQLSAPQVMYIPGPHDVLGEPRIAARHPAAYLFEIPAWAKLDQPFIGRKLTFVVRDGARVVEQDIAVRDHRQLQ